MSNKAELIQARKEVMGILDEKFKEVAEWRWFRAIDRALTALNGTTPEAAIPTHGHQSYGDLAIAVIESAGKPVVTDEIVSFVANKRNRNPAGIKINVQSALSRDDRIASVHWSGGRGWWLKNREVPK
jgi:hypothetical protein